MQQTQKIDFQALMLQPMTLKGVKAVKVISASTVHHLVRAYHPAGRVKNDAVLVKQA